MRQVIGITAFMLLVGPLGAQTADEIMAQVAKKQDADVEARAQYVYHQNLLVRMKRANGKIAREETRDYTVTPAADGIKRELVHFSGTVGSGKSAVSYDKPGYQHGNIDIDGQLVPQFADDFGAEKDSKDGVDHGLFPLRSKVLPRYSFQLVGSEMLHGREVYHIRFEPNSKRDIDEDCWAGEAMIDKAEFQPLEITSHLACKVPVLVKALLGTNVRQTGFKVTYQKFDDAVWFPVTYSGEFEFRAVFVYARKVGIGLINSDFRRAKVDTAIKYEMEEAEASRQK